MDIWSREKRSEVMSKIKGRDTKPEIILRRLLFRNGFRYRVNKKDLPGKPDIVFGKFRTAIFVHGCFWHNHKNCSEGRIPSTNYEFWKNKLETNVIRDKKNINLLRQSGWKVIVVWECEVDNKPNKVLHNIISHLNKV